MSFRLIASVAGFLYLVLSAVLILFPEVIYWLLGQEGNGLGDFLAKRAGVLFIGFSVFCLASRKTESPEVIGIVTLSIGTAMSAIAGLGLYEFINGNAGAGIMIAIVIEVIIATLFLRLWFGHRSAK
ncbi:hypothetical protein [Halovulum sp. GXIMD14793]